MSFPENNNEVATSGASVTLIPRMKIVLGAIGTDGGDVSSTNPLSVTFSSITIAALPSAGSATINQTTAGTSVLIPSTATNSIYITGVLFSNGATACTIALGYGTAAVAPTTTTILIQPSYMAINSSLPVMPFLIKVPSSNNVLVTGVGGTTLSATATYYVAA